ncbi:hypothetical protein Tco_0695385 [Tanacetum coccineum]
MEAAVQQHHVDKQCFEIQKKQFLIENDLLLDQIISQDIVNIVVNSSIDENTSVEVNSSVAMIDYVNCMEMCNKCLELEAELIKQHNMAELQEKDTTIEKLKANIKRLNKTSTINNVKKDIDEIETINIELEHRVTKLIAENEHLKQTYKQLYDSIKPSCVRAKEYAESLINQLNQKKFKGKDIVNNAAQVSNTITIAPGMYKLDLIVEQARLLNPLDSASYSACKYVKLIQELLGYVRDTCPNIQKHSEKLLLSRLSTKGKQLGVSRSTKSSRSKSTDNTKNYRILQISSSTKKNKVEGHSRIVTSSLNKTNCVVELSRNANVQHSKLNTNSELMITVTNKVPLREPIPLKVVAQESAVTRVYTRRPNVPKSVQNSKPKVAKSMTANRMELDTS